MPESSAQKSTAWSGPVPVQPVAGGAAGLTASVSAEKVIYKTGRLPAPTTELLDLLGHVAGQPVETRRQSLEAKLLATNDLTPDNAWFQKSGTGARGSA